MVDFKSKLKELRAWKKRKKAFKCECQSDNKHLCYEYKHGDFDAYDQDRCECTCKCHQMKGG